MPSNQSMSNLALWFTRSLWNRMQWELADDGVHDLKLAGDTLVCELARHIGYLQAHSVEGNSDGKRDVRSSYAAGDPR